MIANEKEIRIEEIKQKLHKIKFEIQNLQNERDKLLQEKFNLENQLKVNV